jgi:hypothetical protein
VKSLAGTREKGLPHGDRPDQRLSRLAFSWRRRQRRVLHGAQTGVKGGEAAERSEGTLDAGEHRGQIIGRRRLR